MNDVLTKKLIRKHENEILLPYIDTKGKITIGVGRNLTDRGISRNESRFLFENDFIEAKGNLIKLTPWVNDLDSVRQAALIDMAFNMGAAKLVKEFKKAMPLMKSGQYEQAAKEFKNSLWYTQVKSRGIRIVKMIRTGDWPEDL